jgi:hypothetical protein
MAQPLVTANFTEEALRLKVMMDGILERVESVFQSYNVPLPNRRYWNIGQPPVDCDQVVVSFMGMYLGSPGDEVAQPQRCNVPRSATVAISISREIPTVGQNGRPPSGTKIQESSEISVVDAWILMESLREFDMWDDTGYGLGIVATLEIGEPEGGFVTSVLNVVMAVP